MAMNFDLSPMLVIWETTQACDLSCAHCRASAQPLRAPEELTTLQGRALLDEVKRFGSPLMVFTGGDPLKRPDLYELMEYSASLGLRTNVSPSATPLLTPEAVRRFKARGWRGWPSVWMGRTRKRTTASAGCRDHFDRAMVALREAQEIGLETQVQTTITRRNMHKIREMARWWKKLAGVCGACSSLW